MKVSFRPAAALATGCLLTAFAAFLAPPPRALGYISEGVSLWAVSVLPAALPFRTCVFGERIGGRVVEKGTLCKMARGRMVRWLAEEGVTAPEDLRGFQELGYRYAPEESSPDCLVFLRS